MGIISSLIDSATNATQVGYNIYQDQRNFNYQKELQQELFRRDDNAIQRRMEDYNQAGINPLFALGGSSAGNSSAGGFSGPQVSFDNHFATNLVTKRLEQQTLKQEMKKRDYEMYLMNIQLKSGRIANLQALQDLNMKKLEYQILSKQFENMETNNFYPYSNIGKIIGDISSLGNNVLPFSLTNPFPNSNGVLGFLSKMITKPTPEQLGELKNGLQKLADYAGQPLIKQHESPEEKPYKVKPYKNPVFSSNYAKTIKFFNDNHKNVKLFWVYDTGINPKGRGKLKLWSIGKKKYYTPNFYDYNSVIRFLNYGDYEH